MERTRFTDGSYVVAQTSTPFEEGGPRAEAWAADDGWTVQAHFAVGDGRDDHRVYVFEVEQAEKFIQSLQRALPAAKLARGS